MTRIFFVKTTYLQDVSLVTMFPQTSYDSGILRQHLGIIRSLPNEYTTFADFFTMSVVHFTGTDKYGRAQSRTGTECV